MDLSPLSTSAGFSVELLLGEPVFAHQIVQIDYHTSRVEFTSAGEKMVCDEPIPMTLSHGVPIVEAELQTDAASPPKKLRLIVDLGTRHFAAMVGGSYLDSPEGRRLQQRATPEQVGAGVGGAVTGSVVRVASLAVGGQRQDYVPVALTRQVRAFETGGADGTLGVPFWKTGSITFDYAHGSICLRP